VAGLLATLAIGFATSALVVILSLVALPAHGSSDGVDGAGVFIGALLGVAIWLAAWSLAVL